MLHCEEYPDPLARVWSALRAPHAGDLIVSLALGYEAVDWGGVTHAGGGSHGALQRGDSLGPLLFVGCGPDTAAERRQWALRDVAPVVLEHFGGSAPAPDALGGALRASRCSPCRPAPAAADERGRRAASRRPRRPRPPAATRRSSRSAACTRT